ncbi:unnamed protein product [Brachionus calyciflorus]|uniref:ALMS motif domain-containing protein n=1 Tax=Brachionus calyciflorus TaxID=104777 RepID=A0A814I4M0_9BILA|nr:unnamed protein product [Brachionus calyciflorus]
MASSEKDPNASDTNNNQINESSYHLKLVSFDDSQVDHFIPYSSPSILYYQTKRKYSEKFYADVSDIEHKRGNSFDQDATKIVQIPEEKTIDFLTDMKKLGLHEAKSDQKLDLLNTSKIAPLSARSSMLNFHDLSNLKERSNVDLNRSKTLVDLENNVQKRLDFLDMTQQEPPKEKTHQTNLVVPNNQPIPVIRVNQADETGEILLELSCESEEGEQEETNEQIENHNETRNSDNTKLENTLDSEINYYKIIDQKLDEMRRKKLELMNKENKNKNSPVAWEISKNINEKIPKKQNSEACTQTSFIQSKPRFEEGSKKSPLSQLKFDTTQQKKFKTMIEAQKHEKRYKELELLAKLERLQAERLKKLIMENSSDETSLMANSYFHSTTSYLDGSIDTSNLENIINKLENKNRRKSEFIRGTASKNFEELSLISECDSVLSSSNSMRLSLNLKRSQVEVLNLKNTSVHEQPRAVKIIKENEIRKNSTEFKELRNITSENRIFSDLSNVKKQIKSVQSDPGFEKIREEIPSPSFSKMSLQDAFMIFKKDLIERSQKRLRSIEERSQMRHLQAEYERKQAEINIKLKEVQTKLANGSRSHIEIPRKRVMSSQEIKNLTKKNYEKLPEVKEKQQKQRLQQAKKLNLIKSSIYKKTIQQHVLSKGTNFGLNFKALNN